MHRIGIMQGRIFPGHPERLQVFPKRTWQKELMKAKKIGFDYVELLYDREQTIENPLTDESRLNEICYAFRRNGMAIHSICADYFTKVAFSHEWRGQGADHLDHLINVAAQLKAEIEGVE